MSNPATQIKWGLGYISGRYGDPLAAVAHKHATDSRRGSHDKHAQPGGWYERGAWNLIRDELAQLHKGEMVLPAGTAAKVRQLVENPSHAAHAASGGGSRRGVIPVSFKFVLMNGSESEMRRAAGEFARILEEEHDIELVAST
jgi:hypothetical protein